jgi:uncharacterized repeat protein (TIGR01451 family)
MRIGQRLASVALLLGLGGMMAALGSGIPLVWAGGQTKTAQFVAPPSTPEPPLADAVLPAPTADPTVDPPPPVITLRVRVADTAAPGAELTYRIYVENTSRSSALNVTVRNPIPQNARFVRATPEPLNKEGELTWQLGKMEPCARKDITLVLAPIGPGEVKNCALVRYEHGECVTTQVTRSALDILITGPEKASLYEAMKWDLFIINTGSTEVTGVVVTDTVPAGLEHANAKNPTATFNVGTLAPGKTRHIEYQVIAKAVGEHCNEATVTATGGLKKSAKHCVSVTDTKKE